MYRGYYSLTRKPFEMSPDPHFYYPTPLHNEAMVTLSYGVQMRRGFVVVTGEVGTGKTLLVRCLFETLNRSNIAFAYVYNPVLSVTDFLTHVLTDLGLPAGSRSKVKMLAQLNDHLVARTSRGETTALIVDEAQLLTSKLLEEIRLLTNLETSQHKLLQIVLVGQPELDSKLDSYDLRQLKQRIGIRCRLEPLGPENVRGYIRQRLEIAGANPLVDAIFPDNTIDAVCQFSRGIPRLVNTICENALVAGFSQQTKQIQPDMIKDVAADLRLGILPDSPTPIAVAIEEGKKISEKWTKKRWDVTSINKVSGETDRECGAKTQ